MKDTARSHRGNLTGRRPGGQGGPENEGMLRWMVQQLGYPFGGWLRRESHTLSRSGRRMMCETMKGSRTGRRPFSKGGIVALAAKEAIDLMHLS